MKITLNGEFIETVGEPISVGMELPHFKVLDKDGNKVKTADLLGKVTLISVVPDINTNTCSLQTKHFNGVVDQYKDINFVTISTNTVAEQSAWCAAEGVENMRMLSDVEESFGYAMNLFVTATGFDARAIYIINAEGVVVYGQIVSEIADEPNYKDARTKLDQILTK
ncbi:peroxiredoxin [Periweissella cryptocerci]|uniref:Peroxiredoxin n=1 Tax=Periweissella cryptocerci TaxID=2506420 RepID=A0A4P6YS82_9LACO|nr:peroxiredoxin [Periweissella cryptocerci]QBO35511.1 peroxiredoxin [Periweissella cryptocerci]